MPARVAKMRGDRTALGILPTSAHGHTQATSRTADFSEGTGSEADRRNPHPMRTFDPSPCSHLNARLLEADHFEVIKFTN